MNEICTDNRFNLIATYKRDLLDGTNIETSPDEMAVIDNILFRFWQMGWLLPTPRTNADHIRAMTDEELAEEIIDCVLADLFRLNVIGTKPNTKEEWLEWLKEEVKE